MHPRRGGIEDQAHPDQGDGGGWPASGPSPWTGPVMLGPADVEAWHARKNYPAMLSAGGPVFGVARELGGGRWALHENVTALAAQDARDALAAHLRTLAGVARDAGDAGYAGAGARESGARGGAAPDLGAWESGDWDGAVRDSASWDVHGADESAACDRAADRLERGATDEVTAGGIRYRVIRADRFIRMGPDGPEPPRPSDSRTATDAAPLVLDPARPAEVIGAVLRAELQAALRPLAEQSPGVGEDARRAARTHPRAVLLPATFMTAEREPGDHWRPHSTGTAVSPREARGHLAVHLRFAEPWQRDLGAALRAAYDAAADRLQAEQCDHLDVDGRHFRVLRVERLVRIGPDGPEPPRPSDPVPPPPPPLTDADLDRFRALVDAPRPPHA